MRNFALLCFLFIVIASSEVRFCRADASPDAVLDTDGKKLRAGDQYYILSVYSRNSGGLSIGGIYGYEKCPINILPESYDYLHGLPATFSPINPKKGVVRVSTDLNIQFEANTRCGISTVWKVGKFDEYLKQYFVTMGGMKGNPGRETIENWFKVEKYGKNYKLVYCPTVCKYCKVVCKDVGLFYKNGRRVIALNDAPFLVFSLPLSLPHLRYASAELMRHRIPSSTPMERSSESATNTTSSQQFKAVLVVEVSPSGISEKNTIDVVSTSSRSVTNNPMVFPLHFYQ